MPRLRLVTFNIAHGRGLNPIQGITTQRKLRINLRKIAALLERLAPDVVALQEIDEQQAVFVQASEDRYEKRAVTIGTAQGGLVPVVDGLKAGDRVVTTGAFMLKSKLKAASIESEGEENEKKEKR